METAVMELVTDANPPVAAAIATGLWDRFVVHLRPSIQAWVPPIR